MGEIRKKAFSENRLFVGYSGNICDETLEGLIGALPESEIGSAAEITSFGRENCAIEIPASVGFSAIGHNLYALGGEFTGACSVLSSLMTYGYLWNMVRVQGGAYGTGMNAAANGDVFCYSYRDPNLAGTMAVCCEIPNFLEEFLGQGMPLDDIIIGTVNTTDPLLDPAGVCSLACARYLRGITGEMLTKTRKEILHTSGESLSALIPLLRKYAAEAKFCAVGDKDSVAFLSE